MPAFLPLLPRLRQDVRDGMRQLRAAKAHSALVVTTLAIGIAASAAIFSVVRGVILRPLPYADPDRLVTIQSFQPALDRDQASVSYGDFADYRAATRTLAGVAAFANAEFVLSGDEGAERVIGATVDAGLLPLLGVQPATGRLFQSGEDGPSPARVVILSHRLWQRRYSGSPTTAGRSITIDGDAYTVVGIMPERFEFPRNANMARDIELWTPLGYTPAAMMRRGMRNLTVIARLKPGASAAETAADLSGIARRLGSENPRFDAGWDVRVVALRDFMVARVRQTLLLLLACVGVLLCIACVNAAAATLARAATRTHALALRLALGATPATIGELLLSESLLLGLLAGLAAIPVSSLIRGALVQAAPVAIPRQDGIGFDSLTLAFTAVVSVAVGLASGAGPALRLGRLDLRTFLADSSRTATGSRVMKRALSALVAAQLALATVLLGATATLYVNHARLNRVDPGFRAEGVLTASLALPGARYADGAARADLAERYLDRVRAIPGVERAAVVSLLPMSGGMMSSGYSVPDAPTPDSGATAALRTVSSDFFQTVGIPLRSGRPIERADDANAVRVAVVNEALVRQSFGTRPALGAGIIVRAPGMDSAATFRVVGIVGDAREKGLTSPATPIIYFSNLQASFPHTVLVAHTTAGVPAALLRATLAALDPTLALDDVGDLAAKVRASFALQAFLLVILAVFALCGATLVGIGVYGSVSFAVESESRALGIRLALGATQSRILRSVVGRAAGLAAIGCAAGILLLVGASRALPTIPADGAPVAATHAVVAAIGVLLLACTASFLPALRASRADPVATLRE